MRKYIIGALIGIVSIGFTNAGMQEFDLGYAEEITSNTSLGYTLELQNNANFLLDNQYRIISIIGAGQYASRWIYFWNWNGTTGSMYVISTNVAGSIIGQGYFNYVNIVDLSNIDYNYSVPTGFTPVSEFFGNTIYSNPDKLLLGGNSSLQSSSICFGYSDINKAVCFSFDRANWNNCSGHPEYCTNGQLSYITNDRGVTSYDLDYLKEYGTMSPFTQTTQTQTPITQYACPTIQQLINAYPEQYNTSLCYSSTTIYSGGQYIQTTPKTIFEIYSGGAYINVRNDINTYFNYCKPPATMQTCQNAFTGKEENYTFVSKLPNDIEPIKLRSYCNMTLNMDPNGTTCTYSTGMINTGITLDDIAREIGDSQRTVITPGKTNQGTGNESGSVYDKYLGDEEDEEKMFELVRKAKDVIKNMKSIYVKITGIFRGRTGTNGVIPEYITGLICLIVLYKLFKK